MSHKIVILGEASVGKTSVVGRFVNNHYNNFVDSTIGANFLTKTLNIGSKQVKLDIWDTAGQERYHSLAPLYYRSAQGILIVYDITNRESLDSARSWLLEVVNSNSLKTPIIYFVGNKNDLEKVREVSTQDVTNLIQQTSEIISSCNFPIKNINLIEVSAKTGFNITDLFHELAYKVDQNIQHQIKPMTAPLSLELNYPKLLDLPTKQGCCWY